MKRPGWVGVSLTSWFCVVLAVAAIAPAGAAEQNIDLDGNPANGAESRLETNVLQSFPVKIENVIFNNAAGKNFQFIWPGAGPGGFDAFVTGGPDVGVKWEWTTVSQVYSIQTPIRFDEAQLDPRGVGVFGAPPNGVQVRPEPRTFVVPGKSIFPTQITLSSASLTSSLVTFFSPEQTLATCESTFSPGRFVQTITNNSNEPLSFNVEQVDCCPEPGMIICEDGCQFYQTDDNNCGDCGIECAFDEFCDAGACEPICPSGQILCGETCVDAQNDTANCGGCGVTCQFDEFCGAGFCQPICPGETLCGETCVDTLTDTANCGDCDVLCAFDEFCGDGICQPICPGETLCGETCVDTLTDTANCGGCDVQCAFDEFCDQGACAPICPGQTLCGETCVDLSNDPNNCGNCDVACGPLYRCTDGACEPDCGPGEVLCGELCIDLLTDDANCGGCDIQCAYDEFCDVGACQPICPGETLCGETCADLSSDSNNCGACGNVCGPLYACEGGSCEPNCPPGQTICGDACVDLTQDPFNCGACANVCGTNNICEASACKACRPPRRTACNNVCVNTNTDPFNCGGCGNVCDLSNCPSSGQGACSQGTSCICLDDRSVALPDDAAPLLFPPDPAPRTEARGAGGDVRPRTRSASRTAATDVASARSAARVARDRAAARAATGRSASGGESARPSTSLASDRSAAGAVSDRSAARSEAASTRAIVQEAPVCDVSLLEMVLEPGESFSRCLSGALTGREVFTRARVNMNGSRIGEGPCAVVIPDVDAEVPPFLPTVTSITVLDESGDGLCQPGEAWCDIIVTIANLGTGDFPDGVATISAPPDQFNPSDVIIISDSAAFADFPAFDQVADCDNQPVIDSYPSEQAFRFSLSPTQEADVSRLFYLTFNNGGEPVEMPFVLGVGRTCDPNDLDGENYDRVEGFSSPFNARLVPSGYPVNFSTGNFNQGSSVPLKVRLACGTRTLTGADLDPMPQIVGLIKVGSGPVPLVNINFDNNSNPNDPFFDCGSNRCSFNLFSGGLAPGTYVIRVAMPDTRIYEAGFTLKP